MKDGIPREKTMKRAAVLWTGGKDCTLALYRAREAGVPVACLATFVDPDHSFKAHCVDEMSVQAAKLGMPIHYLPVVPPFREGYVRQLTVLRDQFGIDTVLTGDIDFVDGHPNWIAECCSSLGMHAVFPLWKEPRLKLIRELIERKIEARITWINHAAIPAEWMGRILDADLLKDLLRLEERAGVDPSGENGEFHTMVTDFPPL